MIDRSYLSRAWTLRNGNETHTRAAECVCVCVHRAVHRARCTYAAGRRPRARARPPPTYVGRTRHKQLLVSLAMGRTLFIYCIAVPKMSLVVVTRPPLSAPEFEFVHMMMMMMTKVLVPAPWTGWARHHDGSNPRRVAARTSPCAPHTGATLCARKGPL